MAKTLIDEYSHTFPAARGVQAGRPCYIAMCPMRLVPKIFVFDEAEVPPELRAQRSLNKSRIPEIAEYLIDNPLDYTLSAITASVDEQVHFEPMADTGPAVNLGMLTVSMSAQILINDGPLHGKIGVFDGLSADKRIKVLFEILGRNIALTVSAMSVSR